ncbi:SDR family NAD(P)-dependent oxidoreductase [Evansella sp. AB-rgal1]|uniref:SDR family NAD(P)-dependent oxidoreductase n=1 Tax=Evansella sp. AB-rgal1 TaxID=3242696 RepID=UPI00359E146E
MKKNIVVTNGNQEFNQEISTYLLKKGHSVTLFFEDDEAEWNYLKKIEEIEKPSYKGFFMKEVTEVKLQHALEDIVSHSGTIDILLHGNEMVNEEELLLKDVEHFDTYITKQFHQMYLLNKLVSSLMVKKKKGSIIFPILYDALYFAGYPSSPILNQGKISMMKCLSRELSAFRLSVNVMTFGYYNSAFDKEEKKNMKKKLEIYGLKPKLPELNELISALDILIDPPSSAISGQDFHIGVGIETGL